MTKRHLGTMAMLAIAAVLVLCSCGGGGSGKRLTKEEFAAKADALCAVFNKQVKAVGEPKDIPGLTAMVKKLLPLDRKLIADVEKLNPPADEEATVNRIVKLGKEQATRIEDLLAALKAGDMAKVNKLTKEGDASDSQSKALFRKIGIKECNKT